MREVSSSTLGWFVGRVPDGWFTEPPVITYDRDEILVVGSLAPPELVKDTDDDARGCRGRARIEGFREDTRATRMRIADAGRGKVRSQGRLGSDVRDGANDLHQLDRARHDQAAHAGAGGARHVRGGERGPQPERGAGVVRAPRRAITRAIGSSNCGPRSPTSTRPAPADPSRRRRSARGCSARRPSRIDLTHSCAMPRRAVTLHLVVLVGLLVAGLGLPARALAVQDEPPSGASLGLATPRLAPLPRVDVQSPSLSPRGRTQLAKADPADAPRSSVSARADPVTGEVAGRFRARFARPTDGALELRMLAGLPAYEAGLEVRDTTVNGRSVGVQRDAALLTIPTGRGRSSRVDVRLRFSYTVPLGDTTVGRFLTQATIGALARHRDALLLGHWFPLWIPPGADADPRLEGYGDIGNFAAGAITTRVQVPRGYEVFGPGTTIGEQAGKATTTITQSGVGLRDLALVVARGTQSAEVGVGEVTVRATAPAGIDVAAAALDAAATLQALEAAFGPYPWSRLEVVEVPLGPQVGGMEWPGAVWIDGFGADAAGGIDLVVAHELGHEWWHALVGNDSIAAPVVDEPLAQFSQCVAATRAATVPRDATSRSHRPSRRAVPRPAHRRLRAGGVRRPRLRRGTDAVPRARRARRVRGDRRGTARDRGATRVRHAVIGGAPRGARGRAPRARRRGAGALGRRDRPAGMRPRRVGVRPR